MADSWRIHGGFMADSRRMGLQKLITVLDMRNGYKGGCIGLALFLSIKKKEKNYAVFNFAGFFFKKILL
jgi:hypothetical protein